MSNTIKNTEDMTYFKGETTFGALDVGDMYSFIVYTSEDKEAYLSTPRIKISACRSLMLGSSQAKQRTEEADGVVRKIERLTYAALDVEDYNIPTLIKL